MKQFITAIAVFISITAPAQQKSRNPIEVQLQFLLPSAGHTHTDAGWGAGLKKIWETGSHSSMTAGVSYQHHYVSLITSSNGSDNKGSFKEIIPLLAGYRLSKKKLFAEVQAGAGLYNGQFEMGAATRVSQGAFFWGLQSGVSHKRFVFTAAFLSAQTRFNKFLGNSFSYAGIHAGYQFYKSKKRSR